MSAVLDAWAVSALLNREPPAPVVAEWIERGGARISWINLGEVRYTQIRRVGTARTDAAIAEVRRSVIAELPDQDLVLEAAAIKAVHAISYADCFAVATAERHELPLVTGDPELVGLERPLVDVVDIRAERGH